ncbi:MAG: enoyl-CoA hydratase/isomerase family protein [Rhodoferax sp.]|nr:enoyl-CoA hydratase/isomerase family protein [Rhodoferax sp.]
MSGIVEVGRQADVACVTLRHPGKLNAMSRAMWRALRSAFESIQRSTDVRCVLVRGHGGDFCAGGDIAEYPAFRFNEASLRDFHESDVWGGLQAVLDCDVPIVAQIEGHCMGAGVEIACCCDIRIAAESARFGAPIARLGFPMALREAALVLREAGALSAREMLLQAAVLGAAEMKARGFLNQVVADGAAAHAALASAHHVATLAPQAARLNKKTLRALNSDPALMEQALIATTSVADEAGGAYRYADSAEHREGIAAFLQKRKPVF